MRTFPRLALIALLLIAVPSFKARAEGTSTQAEGPHFRVVLHFETAGLEKGTLEQVEALWDAAAKVYGLPKGARKEKLEVHLYRDAADYEVAEEDLTGGRFRKNLAFAHYDTWTAHVALQPFLSDEALERIGLPLLTRKLLLHEAAHLIRYTAMPNFRDHPGWFTDGIATCLENRVLADQGLTLGPDLEPVSSTGIVRIQKMLEEGRLPPVAAILADDPESGLGFYERYSARWLFVRFLMTTYPKAMKAYVRKARRLGGGNTLGKRMGDLLAAHLGKKRFANIDAAFHAFLRTLHPAWEESFRSLQGDEEKRIQIAFPSTNALAWNTSEVGRSTYELAGTVEILPNAQHQMNVLLDRSEGGFLCVSLVAGYGVTLFEYTAKGNAWRRCQSIRSDKIEVEKPFRFGARVEGKRLSVSIDDETILADAFPERAMDGPWGLGALSGSAGIWRAFGLK